MGIYALIFSLCLVNILIGTALLIAGLMAFDSGDTTSLDMKILGYSTLSIIPVSIVTTILSLLFSCEFLLLHFTPYIGISFAVFVSKFLKKG